MNGTRTRQFNRLAKLACAAIAVLMALTALVLAMVLAPGRALAAEGDLQVLSAPSTIYVRDGSDTTITLKVKNVSGKDLYGVTLADATGYDSVEGKSSRFTFPPFSRYRETEGEAAGAVYDSSEWGYWIAPGVTSTFQVKVNAADLVAGTYDYFFQLGDIHSVWEPYTDYIYDRPYETYRRVGWETDALYTKKINVKVVVYNQAGAAISVGTPPTESDFSMVPVKDKLTSKGIDFGTVNLATAGEDKLSGSRTINAINAGTKDVLTDRHGNTTSINVTFGNEGMPGPLSFGSTNWYTPMTGDLAPATTSEGGGVSYDMISYHVSYDAKYSVAGTYQTNLTVGTTPHMVSVNGGKGNTQGLYTFPVKITLTGKNPRLLPGATDLKATAGNGQVELAWTPDAKSDQYDTYSVYRYTGKEAKADLTTMTADEYAAFHWDAYELIGQVTVGENETLTLVDGDAENGKTYSYFVMSGEPFSGYPSKVATATPKASIQSKLLAPVGVYANSRTGGVEVEWQLPEQYGGTQSDGSSLVDHFNVYRDDVLVGQVYQSAVDDGVTYGWHDDGTGTGTQTYGITEHNYSWNAYFETPQLYVDYQWSVALVSKSGMEGYRSEVFPGYGISEKPVVLGHSAVFEPEYDSVWDYDAREYVNTAAMKLVIETYEGNSSATEMSIWRSEGTTPPDTTQQPIVTQKPGDFDDVGVEAGKLYTYTVQAVGVKGELSDYYTFTAKGVGPTYDDNGRNDFYFSTADVRWKVKDGTTAVIGINFDEGCTARVYRDGVLKATYDYDEDYYWYGLEFVDDPGKDGTYTYRVDTVCSGITARGRDYVFQRNTGKVDSSTMLKVPDAPTLSVRISDDRYPVLSWTPAETGGAPEGYHIYRKDAGKYVLGTYQYQAGWQYNWYTAYWGNSRYITIQDPNTYQLVDGVGGSYKNDSRLGSLSGINWDDDGLPHEYYITAYNEAGESAPSQTIVFDHHDEDQYGNAIAPANVDADAPAAPVIKDVWLEWDNGNYSGGWTWISGQVHVAWEDSGAGGAVDKWTATFAGTYMEPNNPPRTDELHAHEALADPDAKKGTTKNSPTCSIRAGQQDSSGGGDYDREITVTVTASNGAGDVTSQPVKLTVRSAPRIHALSDNGSVHLQWTDLYNDEKTVVTGWEIQRKDAFSTWTTVKSFGGSLKYTATDGRQYNSGAYNVPYYTYVDKAVENGWTYQYRVVAKCADGIERPSGTIEVTPETTACAETPGAPRNLRAQVIDGTVFFQWDPPATGGTVQHYYLYRQEWQEYYEEYWWVSAGSGILCGTDLGTCYVPNTPGTYKFFVKSRSTVDGRDVPYEPYRSEIEGYDSMSENEKFDALYPTHSNVVEVTVTQADIDKLKDSLDGRLSVSLVPGVGQNTLTWKHVDGLIYYELQRITYEGDTTTLATIMGTQDSYTYVDTTAEPGVRYRYVLIAHLPKGNHHYSADVYGMAMGISHDEEVAQRVASLIEELPAPTGVTAGNAADVTAVAQIWDTLTPEQQAFVSDELVQKLATDVQAANNPTLVSEHSAEAKKVQDKIDALPAADAVGTGDAKAIAAARKAYDALSTGAKNLTVETRLLEAEAALAAAQQVAADAETAQPVATAIDALPEPAKVALKDADAVASAQAAYDALADGPREQVGVERSSKLADCSSRIADLQTFYTVTFDSKGGSKVASQKIVKDGTVTKPDNPTRDGYTFVAWQLDGKNYDFKTKVTTNMTLEAKWKENSGGETTKYTVTFDSAGGSAVAAQTVEKGKVAIKPAADPIRSGYTFVAWQLNGKNYDFSTSVTADITLKATWKKNSSGGGDDPQPAAAAPMYRLYNPNSGEHFYTGDPEERANVIAAGWNDENIGWYAPADDVSIPVYRVYNKYGGEHHYTTDVKEKDNLVKAGWNYEGIGWYSDPNEAVPLLREYNPNQFACNHNYTTSQEEHDFLVSIGWKDEGKAWYGVNPPATAAAAADAAGGADGADEASEPSQPLAAATLP